MKVYADSSLLVSAYTLDRHTQNARRLLAQRQEIWLTPLHRVECAHAFAQMVFQRRISAAEAALLIRDFERDRVARVWLETAMPEASYELAVELAARHVTQLGSQTLDTLHVASALTLRADRFWTFDERQAKLALAEGLDLS